VKIEVNQMKKIAYYFVKYNVLLVALYLGDKYIVKIDDLSMVRAVGIVTVIALYDIFMYTVRRLKKINKTNNSKVK
jgi:hypothetical protein